jgi:hypothetical protein
MENKKIGIYLIGDEILKRVNYSVTKCHIIEVFLENRVNLFVFVSPDNSDTRNRFHNIRLEAFDIIRHYSEWLEFSQAMCSVFKKYGVYKYLIKR